MGKAGEEKTEIRNLKPVPRAESSEGMSPEPFSSLVSSEETNPEPELRSESEAETGKEPGKGSGSRKRLRDRFPNNRKYSVISFYVIITFLVVFILYGIGISLGRIGLALGAGLRWLRVIFVPLAVGFGLAYLFAPVVKFFRRHFENLPHYRKTGKSAVGPAVAVTFVLAAAVLVLLLMSLISAFTHEMTVVSLDSLFDFIKVHPMLVIIALIIGSQIGGLTGMILAVPVASLLKLWLDRWVNWMADRKKKRDSSNSRR